MDKPDVSIIIPTNNEGDDIIATVDCILRNTNENFELIVVDDSSDDHSVDELKKLSDKGLIQLIRGKKLGAIGARNKGAELAKADIVGFIDAHCYTPKGWIEPLLKEFSDSPDTAALSPAIGSTHQVISKGYGATWETDELAMCWLPQVKNTTEVPFIGGAGTFVRKKIFDELGGFDSGIIQWGYEDVELSIRLWLFGHRVVVVPQSSIFHKFRTHFRYKLNFAEVHYNKLRLIYLHFQGHRLRRLLRHHLQYPDAEKALARVFTDGTESRRDQLHAERKQSMDEFCDRFKLVS